MATKIAIQYKGEQYYLHPKITPKPKAILTITQRAFAPWKRFGSIGGVLPNSFMGDDRGFSLKEANEIPENAIALNQVTSRLNYYATFDFENFIATDNTRAFASQTEGNAFFIGPNQQALEEPHAEAIINKNKVTMRILGQDPLVIPAPNIDLTSSLDFTFEKIGSLKHLIKITGQVFYKAFPAMELFIEDEFGTRVFLHTYQVIHEEKLAKELMAFDELVYSVVNNLDDWTVDQQDKLFPDKPNYDYTANVHIEIEASNKDGKYKFESIKYGLDTYLEAIPIETVKTEKEGMRGFLGSLIKVNQINLGHYLTKNGRQYVDETHKDLANSANKLKPNFCTNNHENLTINEWNAIHLNKPAALDLVLEE